ncbi:hypothetical protein CNR33_00026 [Pseudomonas phage tabernarius]|uniref:Uncharacterized protein n=1 Tax=Pseudomonas phage tabernarius TaxID=2048978 RepID=A0A2H4P6S5_9CAUD|nr:hypothetical protein FDJ17_gp26 [Pseudomonas phage tabernarius]ATW57872.1 hypothetical protein CNR33_00026 [Pseudomonas phage tabernarius]
MKLYRMTLNLPSFYSYVEPDREAMSQGFRDEMRAWVLSLPNVGVESWKEKHWYGNDIILVDDAALATIMISTGRFTNYKESPTGEDPARYSVANVELFYDRERIEDKMFTLIERMELAALRLESGDPDRNPENPGWNERTNSPLSGFHLHNCNDLKLCQDYCTDALQAELDEGWRILAVTTQEQRRPDYILGRFNNTYNGQRGRAERG